MATSVNKTKTKGCGSCGCAVNRTKCQTTNGKGDKPRPISKSQYNKNYESINWTKK